MWRILACQRKFSLRSPALPGKNPFVESLAEPFRHLKHASVAHQPHDVLCAFQHRRAVRAYFEMSCHPLTQLRGDLSIEIIRDFAPYFSATDLNNCHLQSWFSPRPNLAVRSSSHPATVESRRERIAQLQSRAMQAGLYARLGNSENGHRLFNAQVLEVS